MAYQYGAIDPSVSSSATERERIEARRAFGLSKASYLSNMDQYYAGLESQKEMQQAGFEQEEKMFDKQAPFEWEKLRLQEEGIETQRYGIDVGAETSRYGADRGAEASMYGVDTRAKTAQGQLGYEYDWMEAQQEQFGFGNRLAFERSKQGGEIDSGLTYEDMGGVGGSGDYYTGDSSAQDIMSGWQDDYFDTFGSYT